MRASRVPHRAIPRFVREQRERAFTTLTQTFGKTFVQGELDERATRPPFLKCASTDPRADGYVNTADPILAKQLFNSRGKPFMNIDSALTPDLPLLSPRLIPTPSAHSVARAWPYRLMTFFFPDSDGILFLGDDAWRRRHSAFTPLFTGSNVARYSQAMLRAGMEPAFDRNSHSYFFYSRLQH